MKKIVITLLVLILAGAGVLFALNGKDRYDASRYSASLSSGLEKGSNISFTLPDQFDKAHTLDDTVTKLIFVSSKSTGHMVKSYLKEKPADFLKKHHTLFVADISPMPVVIRNTFALPDLKKQHYSVLLIYDKTFAKAFKQGSEADKINIVQLKQKEVQSVHQVATVAELDEALK
jgi:hypothetical protein